MEDVILKRQYLQRSQPLLKKNQHMKHNALINFAKVISPQIAKQNVKQPKQKRLRHIHLLLTTGRKCQVATHHQKNANTQVIIAIILFLTSTLQKSSVSCPPSSLSMPSPELTSSLEANIATQNLLKRNCLFHTSSRQSPDLRPVL